jgi:hypothetical protein
LQNAKKLFRQNKMSEKCFWQKKMSEIFFTNFKNKKNLKFLKNFFLDFSFSKKQ